jgi:S-adenosylmethionine hydrolase
LVGPDNGLLWWAVDGCGGSPDVVVLDRPRYWLPAVSSTFHGRDLFGPVAAHLALGVPLAELGSPGGAIQPIPFPAARRDLDAHGQTVAVHGEVVHVDRYGNLITSLATTDLPPDPVVEIGGRRIAGLAPHFQAGTDAVIALLGSTGLLEIAVPNGSAAHALGVGVGAPVTVIARS